MSGILSGVVEAVKLEGPLTVKTEGKNHGKTFHIHVLTVKGTELKKFDFRSNPEAPAQVGENVRVVFSSGPRGNSITELEVVSEQTATTAEIKVTPPTPTTSSTTSTTSRYDNRGARVGGVLHDAVALAIHNAGKDSVTIQNLEGIARDLLTLAAKLENN